MKKKFDEHGYDKSCFVSVSRKVNIDRIALTVSATQRIVARRRTVAEPVNIDFNFDPNEPSTSQPVDPLSVLRNMKNAPFHIRGRRKSMFASVLPRSFVPDDDIINLDHVPMRNIDNRPSPESNSSGKENDTIHMSASIPVNTTQNGETSSIGKNALNLVQAYNSDSFSE